MNYDFFLHSFISYLVIIDPIGVALIFYALLQNASPEHISRMAMQSIGIATVIILLFGFFGRQILTHLGISIEAFRISGGLLLFYTSFHMITKEDDPPDAIETTKNRDISVFPLSIPLVAGPGCLTLTILIFSKAEHTDEQIVAVLAVILVCSLTFFCFLFSKKINLVIGKTGSNIIRRLLGVLLAALSIQFIFDGVKNLLSTDF